MAYTAAPSATPVVRRKPGAANPTEAPPFGEGAMYRTSVPLIRATYPAKATYTTLGATADTPCGGAGV